MPLDGRNMLFIKKKHQINLILRLEYFQLYSHNIDIELYIKFKIFWLSACLNFVFCNLKICSLNVFLGKVQNRFPIIQTTFFYSSRAQRRHVFIWILQQFKSWLLKLQIYSLLELYKKKYWWSAKFKTFPISFLKKATAKIQINTVFPFKILIAVKCKF